MKIMVFWVLVFSFQSSLATMTMEQALENARANLYQADKMNPEAILKLESYVGLLDGNDDWIQVYLYNDRGQMIPQYVNSEVWNRTRGECPMVPGAMPQPYRPEVVANRSVEFNNNIGCVRRVQTHPKYAGADFLQWANKPDGTIAMQSCRQGTLESCVWPIKDEPTKCSDKHLGLLPEGKSFEDIKNSGFDCLSSEAKNSDFLALACNIYFESRGEGTPGKAAVAEVTMNRVRSNMLRTGDPIVVRGSTYYPKTTRGAVYERRYNNSKSRWECQYSWACSNNAVVRFNSSDVTTGTDRMAWMESLYQAVSHLNFDANGLPTPPANLPCYSHYLSLNKFSNYDDLLSWAKTYELDAQNLDVNKQSVCIGAHIFFRSTDNEYRCNPTEHVKGAESGDAEIAYRRGFYEGCLKMDNPGPTDSPVRPENSLCTGNSIQDIICAQSKETAGIHISGLPFTCSGKNSYETGAPSGG